MSMDTLPEFWKSIPGFCGRYEASTKGRIRSVDHRYWAKHPLTKKHYWFYRKGQIVKQCLDRDGYQRVCISRNAGKKKTNYPVHRLVAKTFLPLAKKDLQVNHLDLNKKNNNLENLEWCTCLENHRHSIRYRRQNQE